MSKSIFHAARWLSWLLRVHSLRSLSLPSPGCLFSRLAFSIQRLALRIRDSANFREIPGPATQGLFISLFAFYLPAPKDKRNGLSLHMKNGLQVVCTGRPSPGSDTFYDRHGKCQKLGLQTFVEDRTVQYLKMAQNLWKSSKKLHLCVSFKYVFFVELNSGSKAKQYPRPEESGRAKPRSPKISPSSLLGAYYITSTNSFSTYTCPIEWLLLYTLLLWSLAVAYVKYPQSNLGETI